MGAYGVLFSSRLDDVVSDFLPSREEHTIRSTMLRALLGITRVSKGSHHATLEIRCKGLVGGFVQVERKWWRTTAREVAHTDPWKQILGCLKCMGHTRAFTMYPPLAQAPPSSEWWLWQRLSNHIGSIAYWKCTGTSWRRPLVRTPVCGSWRRRVLGSPFSCE